MDIQQSVLERRAQVEAFQRKHRIGLLTLVFTDIVGSTKLKQNLGDAEGFGRIQQHHAAVREALELHPEGEEISTAGDSFFLVFAKPSEAVKFALRLQARLREMAQVGAPAAVFDRIGIHIGEVIIEERAGAPKPKDLYGIQVDICARVMSAGDADQILMTRSAFDNARQVLKGKDVEGLRDLVWLNHGPYVMQGVEEPLEICEVGEEGVARLRPPEDTEKVRRFVSAADRMRAEQDRAGGDVAAPVRADRALGRRVWPWLAAVAVLAVAIALAAPYVRSQRGGPATNAAPVPPAPPRSIVARFGFEADEGYTADKPLIGQQDWERGGWVGQLDSGDQGVAKGLFGDSSQQAFIGGVAGVKVPTVHGSLKHALVHNPQPDKGTVEVAWKQRVTPSTDGVNNIFEWLLYNQSGQLLCGLIFDNATGRLARRFADNSIGQTPLTFSRGQVVDVTLRVDLHNNRWSATVGGGVLPVQPIAVDYRTANLGALTVTWRSRADHARTPGGPVTGDNRLAFDDIVVTAGGG